MRTTLTLDDDLFAAAKCLARERRVPVGQVISELARRSLQGAPPERRKTKNGFPVFEVSPSARPITMDDIRRAEDEA